MPVPVYEPDSVMELARFVGRSIGKLYRNIVLYKPYVISFSMSEMSELEKVKRLLKLARELEK